MDLEQERALIDPEILELHDAIENGNVELAKEKLDKVPLNATGVDGDTALHLACLYGMKEIVDLLIQRGEDVNATDQEGSTPLHDACAGGYFEIVSALLEAKAAVNVADSDNDTPLHNATNGDHIKVVQLLLSAGADKKAENDAGETPEMLAHDDSVKACFV
uniref:Uncharacterized protein n=1 Tax=Guillardia theta TaxID=55529 RepID=A0A7S4H8K6_GUITH